MPQPKLGNIVIYTPNSAEGVSEERRAAIITKVVAPEVGETQVWLASITPGTADLHPHGPIAYDPTALPGSWCWASDGY